MRLALLQFDTLWLRREDNFRSIERLLEGVECDLVVLPEMFSTAYSTTADQVAEPTSGPTLEWMRSTSHRLQCAIIGTVATSDKGNFYNRMYVVLPDGSEYHYDKRHLFTFAGEDRTFSPGKERIIVEWQGVRILPLVCYDLRFPAWSYLPGQVDILIYSASWAASRTGAWDSLLPARAIENQAWVVGVNRVGVDKDSTPYCGHSAAYDFMGRKMADCGEGACVRIVEIEPSKIAAFRERFRAWQDADKIEIK